MCLDKQGDIMYKKKMCSYYVFSLSLHKLGLPSKQVLYLEESGGGKQSFSFFMLNMTLDLNFNVLI